MPAVSASRVAVRTNTSRAAATRLSLARTRCISAGTSAKGNWSRHSFSYQVPPAESDGGQTVYMLLQDENTVVLAVGTQPMISDPAQVQIWHRCADQVSQLRR